MSRTRTLAAAGLAVLAGLAACSKSTSAPKPEVFTANLSAANEVPPKTSSATGTATVTVNANRTLTVDLAVSGLTPSAQHIHGPAAAGANANVIVPLTLGVGQVIAASAFTTAVTFDSLLVLLRNGQAYVNVHTTANPAGEIRGQLVRQ